MAKEVKREPRYVSMLNLIIPSKGEPFLRVGNNMKKIRRLQRRYWKDER